MPTQIPRQNRPEWKGKKPTFLTSLAVIGVLSNMPDGAPEALLSIIMENTGTPNNVHFISHRRMWW